MSKIVITNPKSKEDYEHNKKLAEENLSNQLNQLKRQTVAMLCELHYKNLEDYHLMDNLQFFNVRFDEAMLVMSFFSACMEYYEKTTEFAMNKHFERKECQNMESIKKALQNDSVKAKIDAIKDPELRKKVFDEIARFNADYDKMKEAKTDEQK